MRIRCSLWAQNTFNKNTTFCIHQLLHCYLYRTVFGQMAPFDQKQTQCILTKWVLQICWLYATLSVEKIHNNIVTNRWVEMFKTNHFSDKNLSVTWNICRDMHDEMMHTCDVFYKAIKYFVLPQSYILDRFISLTYGQHFAEDIFEYIFANGNCCVLFRNTIEMYLQGSDWQ